MMKTRFNCIQCGTCCKQLAICITYTDIIRWADQKRVDILAEVAFCRGAPQGDGFYFEHTITAPKQPCVFLGKDDLCRIYDTRPAVCRDFPHSMRGGGCCPAWDDRYAVEARMEEIKARQDRDFKACVTNFEQLLNITMAARGFGHLKAKVHGD